MKGKKMRKGKNERGDYGKEWDPEGKEHEREGTSPRGARDCLYEKKFYRKSHMVKKQHDEQPGGEQDQSYDCRTYHSHMKMTYSRKIESKMKQGISINQE